MKKLILGFLIFTGSFLFADSSKANVQLVKSLGDSGAGTLRDLVTNAGIGDTIMMNIKGTINLNSPISFTKKVFLLGAFPIHTEINGSALGGSSAFEINAAATDTVLIQGFRFINCSGSVGAVFVMAGSTMRIVDCVFKNNSGSAFGQAITIGANVKANIFNCSFINNATSNQGGAISLNATSSLANIRNCTFNLNSSPLNGGAINNTGSLSVGNCTFLNNSSSSGSDIRNSNGTVEIYNNIFSNPTPGSQLASTVGLWNNQGGNVYGGPSASYTSVVGFIGTDLFVNTQLNVELNTNIIVDGYGLEYFRIASQTSPCVDNGVLSGQILPTDCRRAPRSLYGDNALLPDAGAVELTPFTIISNNSAGFNTAWNNMNSAGFPGPKYMDFDISGGGPVNYTMGASLTNSGFPGVDWIVDGFTQTGSAIPGPGTTPTSHTPAIYMVNINNNNSDIMFLNSPASNSFVAGLNFNNGGGHIGLRVNDGGIHIYGNNFVSVAGDGAVGILLTGLNNATIGGPRHHFRNVVSNYTDVGIHTQNDQTNILGNFIGTNNTGTTAMGSNKGILLQGATGNVIGKFGYPSMNLVSGNDASQIEVASGFFVIRGNIIGPDISANSTLTTSATGILAGINTDGIIGGLLPGDLNVIGGNADGIWMNAANRVEVYQNFIGLSPNASFGFPGLPNQTGINITANGDVNHFIGNGSDAGRNFICHNVTAGINLSDAYNHNINGNFIGIRPDNAAGGNGASGINITGGSSMGNIIMNNVIGGNTGDGVTLNLPFNGGSISDNNIGTDSTGTVPRPNAAGIKIINPSSGGTTIFNNLISGNNTNGIEVQDAAAPVTVSGNTIGLDISANAVLANQASGISAMTGSNLTVTGNTIAGNAIDGIYLQDMSSFTIQNNFLGTNSTLSTSLGNSFFGVSAGGTSNSGMIGGPNAGEGNTIIGNTAAGVIVDNNSFNIGILGNVLFENGSIGISLGGSSPLINDVGDVDGTAVAGNKGRNYPDNLNVFYCGGTATLTGDLEKDVAGDYLFQVYRINPGVVDPSGHGEGNQLVYEVLMNLPAGGSPISFTLPASILIGDILSVTSTLSMSPNYETSEFSDTVLVRGAFSATATVVSNVSCFGATDGAVTVTHGGGAGPFTYDWINVSTGTTTGISTQNATLPSGTYYCSVTEASCTVLSDTITVIEPAQISISSVTYNVNCFGASDGGIDITVTGGVGGYTFDWDNDGTGDFDDTEDLSGIPAGIYTVTVLDANGCIANNAPPSITQPGAISVSPSVTNESCAGSNDGTITLTAAGGNGTFTYQLNGGGFGPSSFFSGLAPATYTWDVMDGNGCVMTGNITVGAGENVIANFSFSSPTSCEDLLNFNFTDLSSAPSGISFWNWTFSGASPSGAIIPNVDSVMFFSPGANNVTLAVVSGNGCTAVFSTPVNVLPNPTVDAGSDAAVCVGTPFTQAATIAGGTPGYTIGWNPAGNFVNPAVEDANVTAAVTSTTGSYTHILNVSDANGCVDADTMILTVNPNPTVNAGPDNSVCLGSSYILSGSGTASFYTWDNSVTDGSPFSPVSTLTYTVTGTNAAGCQSTDQVVITVDNPPTVDAGLDLDECRTTAFSASLNGIVTNASSVLWSTSGSGSWSGTTTPSTTYFYSGADASGAGVTLTLTATSGNSCPDVSDFLTVTFHDPASAFAGNDFSVCASAVNIPLFGSATGQISVDWTNGTGTFNPTNTTVNTNYTPSAAEISAGSVTLILTAYPSNAACPNSSDDIIITLLTAPVADAGVDASICSGQTLTLDASASTGSITTFQWDEVGVGFVSSNVTANVSPTSTTNYAITVGNGSCSDTDTILVTVGTAPDASFNYTASSYCLNAGPQTPSTIVTAGGSFSLPQSPGSINATTGTVDLSTLSPGNYTIYYTLTTPCISVDSVSMTVLGLPDVTVTGPAYGCDNALQVDLNTVFSPATTGGVWSGTGVTDPNFDASVAGAGTVVLTYTATDTNGCTNSDTVNVVIYAAPVVSFTGLASAYCENDAPFLPTGTPAGGLWSVNGSPFSAITSIDPSTMPLSTTIPVNYQYTDPGTGCVGYSNPSGFTVYPMPLDPTTTSPLTQTVCAGSTVTLNGTNPNTGNGILTWFSDVGLTNQISLGPTYTSPPLTASTNVYLVILNAGCYTNIITFTIIVNSASVTAGPDLTICPGTPAQLNVSSVSGNISWSPGISLDDSTIANPLATPNVNTTYVVTVTSGTCTASDSVNVIIDGSNPDCGIVPTYNAFSPDFDGVNDTWIIDAVFNHPDNKVTIYNRWGDKLVSFDDYDNVTVVWDGTYNGNLLPSGTYFYIIEYLDINMQVSGWMQLTR